MAGMVAMLIAKVYLVPTWIVVLVWIALIAGIITAVRLSKK
jgi:hypothetical protein